ncbi:hypothetical protein [Macrococcus equipercicus]|uniref:Uncharacterized protein n=1 Tax=Macrococcus equipercicus TaxID=69967 RepID=A0A9Q9BVE4_9STAP|nr:hypothetical protein [Macrococcus equipercicus]KAA1039995.1 hypothetical protein ERX35_003130 [Macrococcus equipercicus]UTH13072.1 hypothetical protein KFV11_07265 [Macrococcus equipercicus]
MDIFATIFLLLLIAPMVYMYSILNKEPVIVRKHFVTTFIMAFAGMSLFPIIFFTLLKNTYAGSIISVVLSALAAGVIWGLLSVLFLFVIKKWLKR